LAAEWETQAAEDAKQDRTALKELRLDSHFSRQADVYAFPPKRNTSMNWSFEYATRLTRRHFFSRCAKAIGGAALASLLHFSLLAAPVSPDGADREPVLPGLYLKLWEMHSLQNRVGPLMAPLLGFGAMGERVKTSLDRVLAAKPDMLIPSHGVVMSNPPSAVEQLKKNYDAVMDNGELAEAIVDLPSE
jgi:hypothetical protein